MLKTFKPAPAPATVFCARQSLPIHSTRSFTATTTHNMPERTSQIDAKTDPSVTKQYDSKTSATDKFHDLYEIADRIKTSMFNTYRPGVGLVGRSMAVAKRTGPDFLFLANANSTKFKDLEANKEVQLSFRDGSKEDWISVTGEVVCMTNSDPRIKEIYTKPIKAWFGDIGDGVHDGGPEDPRMKLIEVRSKYITYWKRTSGALGFAKEIGGAILTGGVANTGDLRELQETDINEARVRDSALSS